MQNKQALIGIAAALLILLGAGAVFTLNKTKTSPEPATIARSISPTKDANMTTIANVFKSTKNQKCDFDTKTENSETKGTIYVSSDNAFGDINTTANGKTQNISVIRNADTFYIWGDSLTQGIKLTMSVDEMGQKLSSSSYTNFDPNHKTDFKCLGWTPDESKFTPPSNIKFINMGGVSPAVSQARSASQNPSSQCSLCNSMTGEAKATCLSSFSCK